MNPKIATITLNPAIDQTASIPNFKAGEVNRVEWEQADPGGKGVNVASFLTEFGFSSAPLMAVSLYWQFQMQSLKLDYI